MTFNDDFVRLLLGDKNMDCSCSALGIEWPPPQELTVLGNRFKLVRYSQITDEQRASMDRIVRGAEYEIIR